jgi:hypothetical protein
MRLKRDKDMSDVDLQAFVGTLNTELQTFHPDWQPRIDAGATRKSAQLWANGYLLRLDLTEDHLEAGEPGKGSHKYDEIRMVILLDSRDPLDESTWRDGSPEPCTHYGRRRRRGCRWSTGLLANAP